MAAETKVCVCGWTLVARIVSPDDCICREAGSVSLSAYWDNHRRIAGSLPFTPKAVRAIEALALGARTGHTGSAIGCR